MSSVHGHESSILYVIHMNEVQIPGSQEIENHYPFEVSDLAIIQTQVVQ